jgi:hypothetical protein
MVSDANSEFAQAMPAGAGDPEPISGRRRQQYHFVGLPKMPIGIIDDYTSTRTG